MNFLFTLNESYLEPLCVLIHSINKNSYEQNCYYIAYSRLNEDDKLKISECISDTNHHLHFIRITDELFDGLPLLKHITKEAYYRLLCMDYLPKDIKRVLYLDPDTVVINDISKFYYCDIDRYYLSASTHVNSFVHWFNSMRLRLPAAYPFVNSGVMLINLEFLREKYTGKEIFDFIKNTKLKLEFGDQDIINALFYNRIKLCDSNIINLDLKTYKRKKLNIDWVRKNTVLIHYDGKDKPWHEGCQNPLKVFYEELRDDKENFTVR